MTVKFCGGEPMEIVPKYSICREGRREGGLGGEEGRVSGRVQGGCQGPELEFVNWNLENLGKKM